MSFPTHRPRRLRRTETHRRMVRETRLSVDDLILPLFVRPGEGVEEPIEAMPGVFRRSIDRTVAECRRAADLGIPGVILFGVPDRKDPTGSEAYAADGIVPRAIRAIREEVGGLSIWADVCLCEYTDHGHCGVLSGGAVDNDATLPLLARAAVAYAEAGADVVAPSDMMDGRVAAIRRALETADRADTILCSYAAKYASAYYGPFREAAGSTPREGDRRGYQMDPANAREALREVALDLEEGADLVMVKPALAYLDVLARVRDRFDVPVAAYNVSGEYAMLCAAAERGWVERRAAVLETLTSIRRAGADLILTYFAKEVAEWL
ncbi:MAG: porphobilinogen synthase [Candidatus Eisenbacteria bacterium]|nr:porphobilinogen synthase [Candidatus Latescibacterota bacterium]MBD3302909.1 porphobilinogen synthase [Candidatus Eisenbacteria bacterium]